MSDSKQADNLRQPLLPADDVSYQSVHRSSDHVAAGPAASVPTQHKTSYWKTRHRSLAQLSEILSTPWNAVRRRSRAPSLPAGAATNEAAAAAATAAAAGVAPISEESDEDQDDDTISRAEPPLSPGMAYRVSTTGASDDDGEGDGPFSRRRRAGLIELIKVRSKYYLPILKWLPTYDKEMAIADISSGITMGVFLIPAAVAYASLALRAPINGLYTAFFPLLIYCFFGSSKQMSLGPEAITAVLTGTFLGDIVADDPTPENFALYGRIMAFMVGLFLLAAGIFRLGFIESILTHSVVSGLIMAVAIEVMVGQSRTLLGITCYVNECETDESTFEVFGFIMKHMDRAHWQTILVSLFSLAFLFIARYVQKRWNHVTVIKYTPFTLILVVFAIIISYAGKFSNSGMAVLGKVEGGFETPQAPSLTLDRIQDMVGPCLTITVLLFVESFVCAKTYASKHNYAISPNRELVALGMANMIGSFFGAFSAGGSLSRSKLNDNLGARTPMSGFVACLVVLIAILAILPYFQDLPKAVVSAIVFVAVSGLLDPHELLFLWRIRAWVDLALLAAMFFLTLALGIQSSVVFAFLASLALLIKRVAVVEPRVSVLGRAPASDKFVDVADHPEALSMPGALFLRMQGPLHFVNIARIRDLFRRVEWYGDVMHHPSEDPKNWELKPGTVIVIDLENVPSFDTSAITVFQEIIAHLKKREMHVFLVGVRPEIGTLFQNCGLTAILGATRVLQGSLTDVVDDIITFVHAMGTDSDAGSPSNNDRKAIDWSLPLGGAVPDSTKSTGKSATPAFELSDTDESTH